MKRVALVLVVVASGCAGSPTARPVTLTQHVTQTIGDASDPLARLAVPPPLSFRSRAGLQGAVQGSSCVTYVRGSDETRVCATRPFPVPRALSVVRPGEHVRFIVGGGTSFSLVVHPLNCVRRTLRRVSVAASGAWRVDLRPGLYALLVRVRHFEAGARRGRTSGGVGLWVSRRHRLRVVPASSVYLSDC